MKFLVRDNRTKKKWKTSHSKATGSNTIITITKYIYIVYRFVWLGNFREDKRLWFSSFGTNKNWEDREKGWVTFSIWTHKI